MQNCARVNWVEFDYVSGILQLGNEDCSVEPTILLNVSHWSPRNRNKHCSRSRITMSQGWPETGVLCCGRKVQWEDFHSSSQQRWPSGAPMVSAGLAAHTCQNSEVLTEDSATPRPASEATALGCVCPLQEVWPEQEQSAPTHLFQEVPCIGAQHLCKAACVLGGQEQEGRAGQSTPAELGCRERKPG